MQQQQARKKQAFSQPPTAKLKLPVSSPTHKKKGTQATDAHAALDSPALFPLT